MYFLDETKVTYKNLNFIIIISFIIKIIDTFASNKSSHYIKKLKIINESYT
jgi:hypothetical protein